MAEEDGDLEGGLNVRVSDMESIERLGGNAAGVEDFIASGPRSQCELESVKALAPRSKWSDSLLQKGHQ